jgi:hypothetical protein
LIDDPDVFRAAKLMIDQRGDDTAICAARRVDELLDGGEMDGAIVWRRIAEAIEELDRQRRENEKLH